MKNTGGCLCGQVRYTLGGAPLATALCHCSNCQRQSGAAFSVNLLVQDSQIEISGRLAAFEDAGESGGKVQRRFCPQCGSPVISSLASAPGLAALKAGTLDDTSWIRPAMQVWCGSKQDWLVLDPALPAFPKNPPAA